MTRMKSGEPWLYDTVTGDLVGVKDPDGSEFYWQRIPASATFLDLTDQAITANVAQAMTCNTTYFARGISLVDGSKFKVERAGVYNLAFSAQLMNTDTAAHEASIWIAVNGANAQASTTDITVPSSHGGVPGHAVAAWNWFLDLAAGDTVQIIWSADNVAVSLEYTAARTTPDRPEVPSLIVTLNEAAAPPVN